MTVKIPDEVSMRFGDATMVQVVHGGFHYAAVTDDGRVVCWGKSDSGACDLPTGLGPRKADAAGDEHTVALAEDRRSMYGATRPGMYGDTRPGSLTLPSRWPR